MQLRLLFLDDAAQNQCSRQRVGKLVAIGGIAIEASACRTLEIAIDDLCLKTYGFPEGEPFKWSPNKDHWMRENLIGARREQFFGEVLRLAQEHGAVGMVTVADATKGLATSQAETHEMDVLILTLERFDLALEQDIGMVVAARPSGGRKDEDKFLVACAEVINAGTDYVRFKKLVTNIVTMPFANSRLLQLADLVASITTAMVAGHEEFRKSVSCGQDHSSNARRQDWRSQDSPRSFLRQSVPLAVGRPTFQEQQVADCKPAISCKWGQLLAVVDFSKVVRSKG